MQRLIDANLLEPSEVYMNYGFTRIVYMDDIDEMPTVEAEPIRHGHWVDMGDFESCSVCNGTHLKEYQTYYGKCLWVKMDYCPHCGAKMDESTMGQVKPSDKEFTLYADEKPIVTFKDSKIVLHGERKEDE